MLPFVNEKDYKEQQLKSLARQWKRKTKTEEPDSSVSQKQSPSSTSEIPSAVSSFPGTVLNPPFPVVRQTPLVRPAGFPHLIVSEPPPPDQEPAGFKGPRDFQELMREKRAGIEATLPSAAGSSVTGSASPRQIFQDPKLATQQQRMELVRARLPSAPKPSPPTPPNKRSENVMIVPPTFPAGRLSLPVTIPDSPGALSEGSVEFVPQSKVAKAKISAKRRHIDVESDTGEPTRRVQTVDGSKRSKTADAVSVADVLARSPIPHLAPNLQMKQPQVPPVQSPKSGGGEEGEVPQSFAAPVASSQVAKSPPAVPDKDQLRTARARLAERLTPGPSRPLLSEFTAAVPTVPAKPQLTVAAVPPRAEEVIITAEPSAVPEGSLAAVPEPPRKIKPPEPKGAILSKKLSTETEDSLGIALAGSEWKLRFFFSGAVINVENLINYLERVNKVLEETRADLKPNFERPEGTERSGARIFTYGKEVSEEGTIKDVAWTELTENVRKGNNYLLRKSDDNGYQECIVRSIESVAAKTTG